MKHLLSIIFVTLLGVLRANAVSRPNIILTLAGDLGYERLDASGGKAYRTPNLDALAREGAHQQLCSVPAKLQPANGRPGAKPRAPRTSNNEAKWGDDHSFLSLDEATAFTSGSLVLEPCYEAEPIRRCCHPVPFSHNLIGRFRCNRSPAVQYPLHFF